MKRPFRTEYFTGAVTGKPDALGHSCSEQGSVRGAVVRIFLRQYTTARVYFEDALIFTIKHTVTGVQVRYGRS